MRRPPVGMRTWAVKSGLLVAMEKLESVCSIIMSTRPWVVSAVVCSRRMMAEMPAPSSPIGECQARVAVVVQEGLGESQPEQSSLMSESPVSPFQDPDVLVLAPHREPREPRPR